MSKDYITGLQAEIDWLSRVIEARVKDEGADFEAIAPPELPAGSVLADFISENQLSPAERLLLILVLVPHLYPVFLHKKTSETPISHLPPHLSKGEFQKYHFGVVKSPTSDSFLPTGQTFLYLVAGQHLGLRAEHIGHIYQNRYTLVSRDIIKPVQNNGYDPILSNILAISQQYVLAFTLNQSSFLPESS
ncbi:hypothetical protein AB9P05_13320 [Roseivirga sp. BDSF3-8]|uniref:hypothetical protein n=1 Tax=Roseivirga sp. BDSF3-8 TaxID=3241598 RepID=UPI0035318CFD